MRYKSLLNIIVSADGEIARSLSKAVGYIPGLRKNMVYFMRWSEDVPEKLPLDTVAFLGKYTASPHRSRAPAYDRSGFVRPIMGHDTAYT